VEEAHLEYLNAGCDIITTSCTYQASLEGFEKYYSDKNDINPKELLFECVRVAFRAREKYYQIHGSDNKKYIGISIGPYGATLADGSEYTGNYADSMTFGELKLFHKKRIELFLEAIDEEEDVIFIVETIPCSKEVLALLEILLFDKRSLPFFLSVSGHPHKKGCIASGEPLNVVCSEVNSLYLKEFHLYAQSLLVAFGINCTPPGQLKSLISTAAKEVPYHRILCYPNSGESWDSDSHSWSGKYPFDDLSEEKRESYSFVDGIPLWYKSGARIFGGCCRTYPEDIKKIVEILPTLSD